MQYAAADPRGRSKIGCLYILGICSDVSNMWKGERDDLPSIRGIGQDFLIAGDCGVEANLAGRLAYGANSEAIDDKAICENGGGRVGAICPCGDASMKCRCHGSTLGLRLFALTGAPACLSRKLTGCVASGRQC